MERDPVYIRLSEPASNEKFSARYYTPGDEIEPPLFSLKRSDKKLYEVPRKRDELDAGIRMDDNIEEIVVRLKQRPVILSHKLSSGAWMAYKLTSPNNTDDPKVLREIKEALKLNHHDHFYLYDLNDPNEGLHPSWVKTTPIILYALGGMKFTGWIVSSGILRIMASLNDKADFKSMQEIIS